MQDLGRNNSFRGGKAEHKVAPQWPFPAFHTANLNPSPPKFWRVQTFFCPGRNPHPEHRSTPRICQEISQWGEDKAHPLPHCSPLNILSEHRFPTPNMSQVEGELWKELEHKKHKRKYFWQDFCIDLESHLLTKQVNIHRWLVKLGKCNIAGLLPGLNYSSSL